MTKEHILSRLTEMADPVARWYKDYGRKSLPWRNAADPYEVYVSEIMLQQTQVSSVESRFYAPFLHAFPTLTALAEAEEEILLKQWQGLGYYSRARNMHAAAKICAPRLPEAPEDLMTLPGIGRYTAHAVACFGYRRHVPIVDTNIRRVLSRVTATEAPTEAWLWQAAAAALPKCPEETFDYNQALLDIGAIVCRPKSPSCLLCPLQRLCLGKNAPERYPAPKPRKKISERQSTVFYCKRKQDGALLLCKRQSRFLNGYYTLPPLPDRPPERASSLDADASFLGEVRTVYSHFVGLVSVFRIAETSPEVVDFAKAPHARWVSQEELPAIPLSSADTAMIRLAEHNGKPSRKAEDGFADM